MRIGIGLPNAIPGRCARELGRWAEEAERLGFHSLGSIDRLVYDVLDPLVSLGVAAAVTERVELFTTVLNVGWRTNPVLFAKQLATVDLLAGGRLTAGLGIGGWPDDFVASGVPAGGHGKIFNDTLVELRRVWSGEVTGASGPTAPPGDGHPRLLIGGLAAAGYARAARFGEGWVAPLLSRDLLVSGIENVTSAWAKANRSGRPQILTGRYFCCGPRAKQLTDTYVDHYYGSSFYEQVRADCLDTDERLRDELIALCQAGVDDVVLYPATGDLDQVHLLAQALERAGARRSPTFEITTAATRAA